MDDTQIITAFRELSDLAAAAHTALSRLRTRLASSSEEVRALLPDVHSEESMRRLRRAQYDIAEVGCDCTFCWHVAQEPGGMEGLRHASDI